jgi:hypothetical protein
MKALVFEDNLLWSSRLILTVKAAGWEVESVAKLPVDLPEGEAAIINLGSSTFDPEGLVPRLKAAGFFVVGHAGHKEKPLLTMGNEAGCDLVVSNSTLTFKMEEILGKAKEAIVARQ